MPGNLYPIAGMRLYIGGVVSPKNADFVVGDFAAQSWIEIDGWTQAGGAGDSAALVTFELINRGRDLKQKGTANAGTMDNVFAQIDNDPGQLAIEAASTPSDKNNYAFRVVHLNTAERLFIGLVMSSRESGGTANVPRNLEATVEINSNIVKVAP